jgi:hypothetical protein
VTKYAPDSFDALQLRFMSVLCRFQVVNETLGNCENLPNELAPAGYVLNETTKELAQLYDDFQSCSDLRGRTPKEVLSHPPPQASK